MKAIIKEIISLSLYLAIILGCTYLLVNYVLQRTEIEGDSMQPTLSDGDNIIVDKLTYRFKEPQRYDIIAFPYRYEQDTYFVKRIIGLPGEKIRIDAQGIIFINDEALDERYGSEPIHQARDALTPRILGEDEYFVLGDNRNDSMDSRDSSVGLVRREEIIGRAFVRIYPFTSIGFIQNKKSSSEPETGENK